MNRTGHAEVLHYSLSCDVRPFSSQFPSQGGFYQRHPLCDPLDLVPRRQHSAVGTLDQLASALAAFAASPGSSFLWRTNHAS